MTVRWKERHFYVPNYKGAKFDQLHMMSFCCFAFCLSAAHSANIDEKVHKPQSYWSSGCPGKKGDQEEEKKDT